MNGPSAIDNSTILVTGATGFVGSHLVDYLLDRNCKIHCIVRNSSNLQWLDPTKLTLHKSDLSDSDSLKEALENTEYVFHCAGLTKAKTRKEYFLTNAEACSKLYRACSQYGKKLKSIVHLSSLAATGPSALDKPVDESTECKPITYYGKSKLAGEKIAQEFSKSLPIVILRPPVVYGPRETDFYNYLKTISKGWNPVVGRVRRELSIIYVTDLVHAMVKVNSCPPRNGNIFFITDGDYHQWSEVAEIAMSQLDVKAKTIVIPENILPPIASLMELFALKSSQPALLNRQKVKEICEQSWTASSSKFFNEYFFQPQYDLNMGMEKTVEWYKKHSWL
ncbi:MAG: NAD-dependent epimerase/dehydratase family protein [Nitrospinales bacterium]